MTCIRFNPMVQDKFFAGGADGVVYACSLAEEGAQAQECIKGNRGSVSGVYQMNSLLQRIQKIRQNTTSRHFAKNLVFDSQHNSLTPG